ncbi:NADH-quinone oxidoreductase subunit NuoH [Methanomassiliicoccus luminyensis]|uniref:NADH-quinone oxidoreductase subunit NuoH n=1 Tax=Methanomassiliicoccus luminyensis TaxID=1080712 RepID=UPI00035C97F7|nr:NADH-quinone oxidoreductase subunit NuoH [Methanomassiliicoccus luminyensis]
MYLNIYEFLYGITHWLMVDIIGRILDWLTLETLAKWVGSAGVVDFINTVLVVLIVFVVGLLMSITLIWEERKLLGRLMDRRGTMTGPIGLFQNFADAIKTLLKEHIVPKSADRLIYEITPILLIGTSGFLMVTIPYSPGFWATNSSLSVILTFAIFSIAPFAVLIGGWASNNKYTLIGGMRAAAQIIAYEIPLLLSVVSVLILAGSFNFLDVVDAQTNSIWYIVPLIIGAFVFLISMIAELERVPFDLPEAEAELVEGWQTEYGDMRFGLIMCSEYMRGFVGSCLFTLLFLGGWSGPFNNIIPDEIWFIIKVLIVFAVMIWFRGALARVRTDQILSIGWKRLLPLAVVNLFIAILLKTLEWEGLF